MTFVTIQTLDDVAPHISFEQGFVVSRRPNHTVIDYVYTVPETFSTPISLECRGLKFDHEGRIIGRPFHKFFNLGERQRPEDIDWASPHVVLEKLDGSMVHPVYLAGEMVFMTRMGATEQSRRAQGHADQGVLDLSRHLLDAGITPIFEFTAPENRIVVFYDKPLLTLLAAREMVSGAYLPFAELRALGERFGIVVVGARDAISDHNAFVTATRAEVGIEGYVLAFDDGHRIKLKTDGYVLRHRALAGVQLEKNVLAWVATGAVDDVVAILPPDVATRVLAYQAAVNGSVAEHAKRIQAFIGENPGLARKDFAALTFRHFDKRLTGAVFAALDGKDPRVALIQTLAQASTSDPRVEAIRDIFGMSWSVEGLKLPELEA